MDTNPPSDHDLNIEMSFDGTIYKSIYDIHILGEESNKRLLRVMFDEIINSRNSIIKNENAAPELLFLKVSRGMERTTDSFVQKQKEVYNKLTEKEKVILYFLGTGSKREHTAYVLRISINTLRQHQKNVYRKMGFHNKVQMAVWCSKFFKH